VERRVSGYYGRWETGVAMMLMEKEETLAEVLNFLEFS
jgi:hypothetical protein